MSETIRILHVDNDPSYCEFIQDALEQEDPRFEVVSEHSALDALGRIPTEREHIDCILSDYQIPNVDGL